MYKGQLSMKLSELLDKRYLGGVGVKILTAVLAFGTVAYVAYHVLGDFSTGLDLLDAVPTVVTRTITADAYIMRDEEPLYIRSINSGSAAPAIADGGHASMGAKIVDVYSNSSAEVEKRLREIDEQITLLEKNSADGRSVQSTAGLDAEIYKTFFAIRSDCASGEFDDALALRTGLLVDIKKRSILSGEITDYSSQIRLLEQEKNRLRESLGTNLETVYASSTGYYFSEYDGYGEIFSSGKIDTMTYDDFTAMTESDPVFGSGFSVGTMVHDFNWYIACPMSKADAGALVDQYGCTVTFEYSDISLEMDVYRVVTENPGDHAIVVFRCEKMPAGFDYTRRQPVEISAVEYKGFEIPISAVRLVGGFEGVYVLDEVTVKFRRINIVYQNGNTVVCTGKPEAWGEEYTSDDIVFPWIRQNDIIVLNGTDLYSGKVISQND